MSRHSARRTAAFAIVVSLLLLTAVPASVQSSSHNESVASAHTTDTDFAAAATLENVSVVGSGASASVEYDPNVVADGFEDDDISEWGGETSYFSVQSSTVSEGSWALTESASSSARHIGRTDATVSRPGTVEVDMYLDSAGLSGVTTMVQSEVGKNSFSGYLVEPHRGGGDFRIFRVDSGTTTQLATETSNVPIGEWFTVRIEHFANGTVRASAIDSSGTVTDELSVSDATYSTGGVGAYAAGGHQTYWDEFSEPGATLPARATYVSDTHAVSRPTTAWADLTLSDAHAHVSWLADTDGDGTFETTAASTRVSSSSNVTLDVSGTTADAWRTNVTVVRDASGASAALDDEGLLFDAWDPSASNLAPDGTTVTDSNSVTLSADVADPDFATAQGDSVAVEFEFGGSAVDTQTVTSNQTVTTTVSGYGDGTYVWNVSMTDAYGGTATSSDATVTLDRAAPSLSNPQPPDGGTVSDYSANISVDLLDGDFPDAGDTVTVEFIDESDSSTIATATAPANGTINATWSGLSPGENRWTVEATDDYGHTTTLGPLTLNAPAELEIRKEETPSQLVTNANATLEFYFSDGSNQIVTRNATGGAVNMTGLPSDESFVVVASADGYHPRRVWVESLFETQTVYLLNDSSQYVDTTFQLEDFTGDFPESVTVLQVQRNINGSWSTVQGDFFGATGEWTAQLSYNTRHRLILRNTATGETREVGAYTPVTSSVQTIRVLRTSVELEGAAASISIGPQTRTLRAWSTGATVDVDANEATIENWTVTVTARNAPTSAEVYNQTFTNPGGGATNANFNLSGFAGGTATVDVVLHTDDGTRLRQRATFRIAEHFSNPHSLVSVADDVAPTFGIGAGGTTLLAAALTVLISTGAAAFGGASSELVASTAMGCTVCFAAIGWFEWRLVFATGVVFVGLWALWRGVS